MKMTVGANRSGGCLSTRHGGPVTGHRVRFMELHPQVLRLLQVYTDAGFPKLSDGTVETARSRASRIRELVGDGPPISEVVDLELATPGRVVHTRRYVPELPQPGRIVWYHGGGFVTGELWHHDPVCKTLVKAAGIELISIGYRRAPEHPFPAGITDAYHALEAVAAQADGAPVIVGGDSSGGNFAAVVCQMARDHAGPEVAMQVLVYPVTDCDFATESYKRYGDVGLPLGRAEMEWFWDKYIAEPEARTNPLASPLRAAHLGDLPPAHLVLSGRDVLLDEGLRYAERLEQAGVSVDTLRYDDVLHGFFTMAGYLERSDQAIAIVGQAIRERARVMSEPRNLRP